MWKEYYSYGITMVLPGAAGAVFTPGNIRIDTDSDFEFIKTAFSPSSARVRVKYRDDTNGRYLQKDSQDIRSIGGTTLTSLPAGAPTSLGLIPFIWPKPYIISASTNFTVEASAFSGAGEAAFRLAFHGSKIRPGQDPWDRKYRAMMPYVYPVSSTGTVTIGASGSLPVSIPTDNDAHFLVYKVVGARTGAAALTVKDGGRDRQWMNTEIHIDSFIGNGQFPNILASPRFIARGSVYWGIDRCQ